MSTTITIGADRVTLELLDGWESFILSPTVAPIVAEVAPHVARILARVLTTKGTAVDLRNLDSAQLIAALGGIDLDEVIPLVDLLAAAVARVGANLPPATLESLARKLLAGAQIQLGGKGKAAPLLDTLAALPQLRALALWRIFAFAVMENYADFFGPLRGRGGASPVAAAPSSEA